MNKTLFSSVLHIGLVLALLGAGSFGQNNPEQAARSDEILRKVRELELLDQILPVLMTREQLREILPAVERARQGAREHQEREFQALLRVEERVDAALERAYRDGDIPNQEMIREINNSFRGLTLSRQIAIRNHVIEVRTKMEEILNEGQIRSAANSLDLSWMSAEEAEALTQEEKLDMWVQAVLLDYLAYDILVRLSRETQN